MDFLRYYKRFLAHCGGELWSFGREQMAGVILAVLILLFQIQKGLIPAKDAALTAKVTVLWPYLVLIAIYLAIHLVRTPWKLDQQKINEITSLEDYRDRLIPKLKLAGYAVQDSPLLDAGGHKAGHTAYFQLEPKCLTESNIIECRGFITSIEMWDGFKNGWDRVENEVMILEWSHRGYEPIVLYAGAESRLNVFQVPSSTKEIKPCVEPYPARFLELFNRLDLREVRAVKFNIRVAGKDCLPVDLTMKVQLSNDPFRPYVELDTRT